MNKNDVDKFEKLTAQLMGIYEEISLLSKKSPSDAVNKFKLKFINALILDCNSFLPKQYKPLEGFTSFEEDDIPQNSDVVFILSQYLQCLEKLRADNVVPKFSTWSWKVKGDKTDKVDEEGYIYIRTSKPKHLKE